MAFVMNFNQNKSYQMADFLNPILNISIRKQGITQKLEAVRKYLPKTLKHVLRFRNNSGNKTTI